MSFFKFKQCNTGALNDLRVLGLSPVGISNQILKAVAFARLSRYKSLEPGSHPRVSKLSSSDIRVATGLVKGQFRDMIGQHQKQDWLQ